MKKEQLLNDLMTQGITTLQWLAVAYVVILILLVLFADFAIFHPPKPTTFTESSSTHTISVANQTIKATYLPVADSKHVILYSHGNAEDLGMLHPLFEEYQARGYSIFAYEYEGYGLSSGKASEPNLYRDIEAAYRYLIDELQTPPEKIIAYGRSLGSGPTVNLASKHPVKAVILEVPFTTAFRVITHIPVFPYDKFRNLAKIKKINAPLFVIHGEDDTIISTYHGKKLFKHGNEPKMSYWIPEADHNDLLDVAGEDYWQALDKFIQTLYKSEEIKKSIINATD